MKKMMNDKALVYHYCPKDSNEIRCNTAFIRCKILMLNCENLAILWSSKARFCKVVCAKVLFEDVESRAPSKVHTAMIKEEEKGKLRISVFSIMQILFNKEKKLIGQKSTREICLGAVHNVDICL